MNPFRTWYPKENRPHRGCISSFREAKDEARNMGSWDGMVKLQRLYPAFNLLKNILNTGIVYPFNKCWLITIVPNTG